MASFAFLVAPYRLTGWSAVSDVANGTLVLAP